MSRRAWTTILVVLAAVVAVVLVTAAVSADRSPAPAPRAAAAERNPALDPGTPLHRRAPGYALTDQFGRRVSLGSYRGKVLIVAFIDPECTTICPLTTTAMLEAKRMLGRAGARVQLVGIDANPTATSVKDVRAYSQSHAMMRKWRFLTGPLPELKRVWAGYGIQAELSHGMIDHTPALYVVDTRGRERKVYMTQQAYGAIGQLGQLLAHEASGLLAGHPPVHSQLSYAQGTPIDPGTDASLPRAGGGSVSLGPGSPRLVLFFDTWDEQVTALRDQLSTLNRYQSQAGRKHLPPLTAIDEGTVEPSPAALPRLVRRLPRPPSYPVAIDSTGRVADGYQVQDEPWLMLVSGTGDILWHRDVSTNGWMSTRALTARVRSALAHAPRGALSSDAAPQAPSAQALQSLHAQAGQLLGAQNALDARLQALRGHSVVLNAWASWCNPCQKEFPLFDSASKRYGDRVGFLGADTGDSTGDARAFLDQHPIGYPSYQATTASLGSLAGIEGLPTTIFIGPAGKVVDVHTGQYSSQTTLDQDIERYSLGG